MSDKPALTDAQKREMFRRTATDEVARREFAESRAEVINPLLDEQSTIRPIFRVEYLEPGTSPVYDIPFDDMDVVFMMPQVGGIPFAQFEAKEVRVDTFGLVGGVEYQRDIALDGRIQMAEQTTRLLMNKFVKQEELAGWKLIKRHAATLTSSQTLQAFAANGTTQSAGSGLFNIETLIEAETMADELGTGGRVITDVYLSPRRFADLKKMAINADLTEQLRNQIWNNGGDSVPGTSLRFHKVYNTKLVANNKGYAFTQKEGFYYGVMPIRERLTTQDNILSYMEHKIGIFGRERLGMAVLDPKGLIELTF
jgi:hypothetical protein